MVRLHAGLARGDQRPRLHRLPPLALGLPRRLGDPLNMDTAVRSVYSGIVRNVNI